MNGATDAYLIDSIHPIPLSVEFLLSHGWERINEIMVFKEDKLRIGWCGTKHQLIIGYCAFPCKVDSLHQMQNILSMSGLNEALDKLLEDFQ